MGHSHYPAFIIKLIFFILFLLLTLTNSASTHSTFSLRKRNDTKLAESFGTLKQKYKLRNLTETVRQNVKPVISRGDEHDEFSHDVDDDYQHEQNYIDPRQLPDATVVVLTSLSGIYVWWPTIFGGDNSFHLLLSQEDVPRFHDVTGDEKGHIYLTAPHERTVYRLQYSDGWWIANFSNHSVMNSIRNEMPLFLTLHHVSSVLYVYGHSDIQTIDLLERPSARGSAPFMSRLRELSPNLRISDLIIDQLTSDGYIIGDSYGWCTVIRCSLAASECTFLFKIPSSYDNRPYPCTATIDFSSKIIYLSLEEKILGVYLNEQTNYDRRFILTEKRGPRSTLGYDDIITYNQTIFYTDVLRPLLHFCRWTSSYSCLNMSLAFSPPQRPILPLRLSVVRAPKFRPPLVEEEEQEGEEEEEGGERDEPDAEHEGSSDNRLQPSSLIDSNRTSTASGLIFDETSSDHDKSSSMGFAGIIMLILGIVIGLIFSGISFAVFYFTWWQPKMSSARFRSYQSSTKPEFTRPHSSSRIESFGPIESSSKSSSDIPSSDHSSTHLLSENGSSSVTTSSVHTTSTSSSSYRPDIVL